MTQLYYVPFTDLFQLDDAIELGLLTGGHLALALSLRATLQVNNQMLSKGDKQNLAVLLEHSIAQREILLGGVPDFTFDCPKSLCQN